MRQVGRVLPRAVENAEVLRAARAGSALRRWEEAVGPLLASKSVPDRYDKGTVWVATQGSAWAQELRLMKPQILERLEAMAGERGMFVDIRFGVRPARIELPPEEPLAPPGERRVHRGMRSGAPQVEEGEGSETPTGKVPLRDRPAVPPAPIAEAPKEVPDTSLTIRERAARRLANWKDPGA